MILSHKGHVAFDPFSKRITKSWLGADQWNLASSLARVLGSIHALRWQFGNSCNGSSFQLFGAGGSKISSGLRSVAHYQDSTILKDIVEIVLGFWTSARKVVIVVADLRLVVIDSYVLMPSILASILSCVNGIFF